MRIACACRSIEPAYQPCEENITHGLYRDIYIDLRVKAIIPSSVSGKSGISSPVITECNVPSSCLSDCIMFVRFARRTILFKSLERRKEQETWLVLV